MAQPQQVGPAVVPDAVHHAFAFGYEVEVELGDGQALALAQWSGQIAALRTDHRRMAAPLEGPLQRSIGRDAGVVAGIEPGGAAHHKTTGF